MCNPNQTQPTVLQKNYNIGGVLYEVLYRFADGDVFCIEISEEDRMEFEYPSDEPNYVYDDDFQQMRPATCFIVPDDLTDAQLATVIWAKHEEDEPLYTKEEWEVKTGVQHDVSLEYPSSFQFEIQAKEDIFGNPAELTTITGYATYDEARTPQVQLEKLMLGDTDIIPIINALSGFKNAEGLFYEIEKRAREEFDKIM